MRLLVLGAARSGLAAGRLAARLGQRVSVYDADPDSAAVVIAEGLAALVGVWDSGHLDGVDLVVASPGFPERSEPITAAYEAGVAVESEVEFGWRHLGARQTVAITGTNGKTTVTGLIARMLQRSGINAIPMGNIGSAVSDSAGAVIDTAVIEVSSAQLQLCHSFRPDVAVITNVTEDHLDWHGSVHAYRMAKVGIVARQGSDDVVFFNADDAGAVQVASKSAGRQMGISALSGGSEFGADATSVTIDGARIERSELKVADGPFIIDLLLAGAAAMAAGATTSGVIDVAKDFLPDDHRQRTVADVSGVTFVNDSKATNPHAALAAIDAYPSVVLIAGGQAKGLDITELVLRHNVRAAFVMGESAGVLHSAAPEKVEVVESMSEAVNRAWGVAGPGDVILLSPGGASWDMFSSYVERGDSFAAAARQIAGGER